jgi:toxic protein SymE
MTMKKTRELTVYTKYRERRYDTIIVPEIRLMGRWLQKVGFKQGQIVKVEMHKGKLIISPENTVDPT